MGNSPDQLFSLAVPGGGTVSQNYSDLLNWLLNAQDVGVTAFVEKFGPEMGKLGGTLGALGAGVGAFVSALENNAQGISIGDNFDKSLLDGLAGFAGTRAGIGVVALGALAAGVEAPIVATVAVGVAGGIIGSLAFNYLWSLPQQQVYNQETLDLLNQAYSAGQPLTLQSTEPGVPPIDIYSNGTITIRTLQLTLQPDGSVTTPDGTLSPIQGTGQQGFNYEFTPSDGSAPMQFGANFNVDSSGNVSVSLNATDGAGNSGSTGYFGIGPMGPVSEAFSQDGTSGSVAVNFSDASQDTAQSVWTLSGNTVVGQTLTDREGNVFDFQFDANGAADYEQIHPTGTTAFSATTWDTLNQQPWTTLQQQFDGNGHEVTAETFNRDGSVGQYSYDSNHQLAQFTSYVSGFGATRWTWDTLNIQPYSATNQSFDALMRETSITQFMRSGDVFYDNVDAASGRVTNDTHYRPNGGNTTITYDDWNQSQGWATIVQDFTAPGAIIDQSVFNHDGSIAVYHYDVNTQQMTEEDVFSQGGIAQFYYGNAGTSWNYIINSFDAQGNYQSQSIGFKDGTSAYYTNGYTPAPAAPGTTSGTTAPSTAVSNSATSTTANAGSPGTNVYGNSGIALGSAPSATIVNPAPDGNPIGPVSTTFNLPTAPATPTSNASTSSSPAYSSPHTTDPIGGGTLDAGGSGSSVYSGPSDIFEGPGMPDDGGSYFTSPGSYVMSSFIDPLIINPNGTVTLTTAGSNGITFDLSNSGLAQQVGWVTSGEGFLVSDPDGTPVVNGTKLIGNVSDLSAFDSDGDGAITPKDAGYSQVAVWMPGSDGTGGTIDTLAQLGISEINLKLTPQDVVDHGNIINGTFSLVVNGTTLSGAQVDLAAIAQGLVPASIAPAYVPITTSMTPSQAQQLAALEGMAPQH